jgi:hydroxyacylglutathione hydrolase
MQIKTLELTDFQQNVRILFGSNDNSQNVAVVIDPGGDSEEVINFLKKNNLELEAIWLTHSHLDHCGGVADLLAFKNVPLYGSILEAEFRKNVTNIAMMYGLDSGALKNCPEPSNYLEGGEQLSFLNNNFQVIFCPGHSPGHLCFYAKDLGVLIAGDTIFAGSIGRTDLPGGNHGQLIENIKSKLLGLPSETRVLSGHGPDTTIGHERASNPWLRG